MCPPWKRPHPAAIFGCLPPLELWAAQICAVRRECSWRNVQRCQLDKLFYRVDGKTGQKLFNTDSGLVPNERCQRSRVALRGKEWGQAIVAVENEKRFSQSSSVQVERSGLCMGCFKHLKSCRLGVVQKIQGWVNFWDAPLLVVLRGVVLRVLQIHFFCVQRLQGKESFVF